MEPKDRFFFVVFFLIFFTGCGNSSGENSDPVLVEYPVVYIERDIFTVNASADTEAVMANFSVKNPTMFNPGANLFIKKNASASALSVNLTAELFPTTTDDTDENAEDIDNRIDIRDLTVSEDGQQFLVSIRAPEIPDADDDEQPKWNIWRYSLNDTAKSSTDDETKNASSTTNTTTGTFERLIIDDNIAEQGDDLMASFLPDGRIIFASNRQRLSKAILLDEGKSQYQGQNERQLTGAFNIHVMQSDGSSIKQLSYNLSHDFYPLVMQNGKVLYSRWDAMGGVDKINLYQMNPDGTENHFVYGWHSQEITVNGEELELPLVKPQQLPTGDIFFMLKGEDQTSYQKRPVIINVEDFIDENQAIDENMPEDSSAFSLLFPSNEDTATTQYTNANTLNNAGRISHVFPMPDASQRYLLSLDLCRVTVGDQTLACSQLTEAQKQDTELEHAEPSYALWLFNQKNNTQSLVARPSSEGKMLTEAIVLQTAEINTTFIADKTVGEALDTALFNEQAGAIHIRSVYDFSGEDESPSGIAQLKDPTLTSADERPARFLRLLRGVPRPSNDVRRVLSTDYGRSRNQLMREIIGYTPIQPDGSVKIKVPANVPLALSILDKQGKRITGRHRQWITVKAGETLECNGCHASNNISPHGRIGAEPYTINSGAISGGIAFPNATNDIIPEAGQTMAEAAEQTFGLAELSSDLVYEDIWSDETLSPKNTAINLLYSSLETIAPTGSGCFENWLAYCRIQINYAEHIAPLWTIDRFIENPDTAELENKACVSCHQAYDGEGIEQIAAAHLDLSSTVSDQEDLHLTSYRELLFTDNEQFIEDGFFKDLLVEETVNGEVVYETVIDNDEESDTFGERILELDDEGQPIPVLTTVSISPSLSTASARASTKFFNVLEGDTFETVDHRSMLSPSEIRLISEWLDIGAQYYNTPFYQQP